MKDISLTGEWRLLGCEPQPTERTAVCLPELNAGNWLPITVPGDVNQALLDHGKIPDPHFDVNARQCYWVISKDWWLLKEFDYDMSHQANAELLFDGVDGPADVWLNGNYLGTMSNYFHPHSFDATKHLREKNSLLVRFQSIGRLLGNQDISKMMEGASHLAGASFIRKPEFSFGWDWALPLPSIGLGGDVILKIDSQKRFHDFGFRTFTSGRIDFFFEVTKPARDTGYEIVVNVEGFGASVNERIQGMTGEVFKGHGANGAESTAARFKSYLSVSIPRPKLWWPNGYGAPALYDYEVQLRIAGETVDTRKGRLGLREVEIVEEPFRKESGSGFSFGLKVNGVPIFCKGTNMAPFEIWPTNVKDDQYLFYLRKCKEAHFNMIRIWGGGFYERDILYNLCDEMGLMVWQDFMFASAGYPLPKLRDSIITEAQYQIRRLRVHPCIAIWCGCNEDVYSWEHPAASAKSEQRDTNDLDPATGDQWAVDRLKHDPELYTMLLRGLVGRFGMGVPYVESSPSSHDDIGNAPNSGNSHISSLKYALFQSDGHPENFRRYFEQVCSFDSEFCIHGPCAVASFKRFLAPDNQWPPNDAWIFHIQRGHYKLPYFEQMFRFAGAVFGPMNDLGTYVKHGQAIHLEMMRGEFESARRNRPDCGGTMFWMYNDCWPTANWSVIDYYRTPKPAYYAAKRACAPLLPIIMERKGFIEFFMSNESPSPVKVEYVLGSAALEGQARNEIRKRFTLPANSLRKVHVLEKNKHELPLGDYWFAKAKANGEELPSVTYFPDGWKDIQWPAPDVSFKKISQRKQGKTTVTQLRVSTKPFARLCHLVYPDDAASAWFSDNFFDLPAGESRDVFVESANPIAPSKIKIGHWLAHFALA